MFYPLLIAVVAALAPVAPPAHDGGGDSTPERVRFRVRIDNVSTATTLMLSNGNTAAAPIAPVLWVVHTSDDPIFTAGARDRGLGLERLAEDGDPSELLKALEGRAGIAGAGFVHVPVGADSPGPIGPGQAYEFSFEAVPGQKLSIAMMFVQSNDLFYAFAYTRSLFVSQLEAGEVDLFYPMLSGISFQPGMMPISADLTNRLVLWDAGTEANQEPGLGRDQAPRQKGPDTGKGESRSIQRVDDAYSYPAVSDVLRVTITPAPLMEVSSR